MCSIYLTHTHSVTNVTQQQINNTTCYQLNESLCKWLFSCHNKRNEQRGLWSAHMAGVKTLI